MTDTEFAVYIICSVIGPLLIFWAGIIRGAKRRLSMTERLGCNTNDPPTYARPPTPGRRNVGDFDQFRKCTSCDWCDQSSTATRDRHICPKCGASASVVVGRWVLEGNGPIRFEERHP